MKLRVTGLLLILALAAIASPAVAQSAAGWKQVAIPATGSYFWRYVPVALDRGQPAPVVIFLHGSGADPQSYLSLLRFAAETSPAVLVVPKSASSLGWGFGEDEKTVEEALRLAALEVGDLRLDPRRVGIAGHSSGGAYAYQLAYLRKSRYSAVFTLAAPFYPVAALVDPSYRAPIHMYYGTLDPNYLGGSYAALKAQWTRLGVPWEEDVQAGFGHGSWPASSLASGLQFVRDKSYPGALPGTCEPGPETLCLGQGRFQAEVTFKDFAGVDGRGKVVGCASDGSGLFWFFSPDNWELMVKVIDACAPEAGGHFWVFSAATTSVEYELVVTDTATGRTVRYGNASGQPAPATTDTTAFTCN